MLISLFNIYFIKYTAVLVFKGTRSDQTKNKNNTKRILNKILEKLIKY